MPPGARQAPNTVLQQVTWQLREKKGTPIWTPKYDNPYYASPQGDPHMIWVVLKTMGPLYYETQHLEVPQWHPIFWEISTWKNRDPRRNQDFGNRLIAEGFEASGSRISGSKVHGCRRPSGTCKNLLVLSKESETIVAICLYNMYPSSLMKTSKKKRSRH